MRKHPVSIALSKQILEKIDHEANKQKRSRSEWVELHFEAIFQGANMNHPVETKQAI